jgi:hypothetical protein
MNLRLPKHLMICSTVKRYRFILTSLLAQALLYANLEPAPVLEGRSFGATT